MKKAVFAMFVLAVAASSFMAGGRYGSGRPESAGTVERKVLYYVDPMNPGIRWSEPGVAPCGMPLEPVYEDAEGQDPSRSLPPGTVKVSASKQQLIGVRVAPAELRPMTYMLRLYGKVVADETLTYRLNASTDSWIRTVSGVTTGSIVQKDQILAEALAPSYYNAQVTYLVAMDNLDRIKRQLGGQLRHQQADLADNQIRVAVQALQNLGITDAQIEDLANTRRAQPYLQVRAPTRGVVLKRNVTLNQWFKASEDFYTIADIGRVWVYADVYEEEARHLRPGMKVSVTHKQMGKTFDAKISRVLPLFDPVSKTLKVRVDVHNPRYELRPDMFVDIEIPITMPPSINVPADAVIDSGTKAILYVDIGSGAFEPREVETGWRLGRQVEIKGGLMQGESVVVSGNFLIDSESRMRTASGAEAPRSKDPFCGMYVYTEKADSLGKTATFANQTFYFCSDRCRDKFGKEPGKYAPLTVKGKGKHRQATTVQARSWLDMIETGRGGKVVKHDGVYPGKQMDTTMKSASKREVVDWDGPEPGGKGAPARDWSGWGKFPGSKYLGMKDDTKKMPERVKDLPEDGNDAPSVAEQEGPEGDLSPAAGGFEVKNEISDQPVSERDSPDQE